MANVFAMLCFNSRAMPSRGEKLKILDPVIMLITITVMDDFALFKLTTNMSFKN